MTSSTNQSSKSGNNSTTLQVETVNIQHGFSYSDVKEIALDVFRSNFLELSQVAGEIAIQRAEEITNNFLERLRDNNSDLPKGVNDPGFQHTLFEAQKSYAKTGDKAIADISVDILIERLNLPDRDLKQIVLDESIQVISKLTVSQIDTLTVAFLLKYSMDPSIINLNTLKEYLEKSINPFIGTLSKESSLFQHLEYTGCATISIGSTQLEDIFMTYYKGLFYEGFGVEVFEERIGLHEVYSSFIVPCLQNSSKFQISAINDEVLDKLISDFKPTEEIKNKLKTLFEQFRLSRDQVKNKVIELSTPFMEDLFKIWNDSKMKNMSLTSVGIAIAQANFKRKTGEAIDLGIWIK